MDSKKRPTRNDVARLSGVSSAVVSYVINDGPRPVADRTRQKVLAAMEELGYRPNSTARAFRLQKTYSIGLLVPDISNPFFAELAREISEQATARKHAVFLNDSSNASLIEEKQIQFIADRQPDGVLVMGRTKQTDLTPLTSINIPVVAMDSAHNSTESISSVSINDYEAMTIGLQHLIDHGHTQIALITGLRGLPASDARLHAWHDITRLPIDSPLSVHAPYTRQGGFEACVKLLDSNTQFTALFAASDIQAIGALRALTSRGIQVPTECAVLSFDGTQEAEFSNPPLSVIQQPIQFIAKTALELLLDHPQTRKQILAAHTLLLRESCGCTFNHSINAQ